MTGNRKQMKTYVFMFTFLVLGVLNSSADARSLSCYTPSEAAAEQALRLHSELLVIGLNCQNIKQSNGENTYQKYQDFTKKHAVLLEQYEKQLLSHFRKQGSASPEKDLNELRTNMANNLAGIVADVRPDVFCFRHIERLNIATTMTGEDVHGWATTYFQDMPPSKPFCMDSGF